MDAVVGPESGSIERQRAGEDLVVDWEEGREQRVGVAGQALEAARTTPQLQVSERFVEFLSSGGRVTTTQAVDLIGMSRPTVT